MLTIDKIWSQTITFYLNWNRCVHNYNNNLATCILIDLRKAFTFFAHSTERFAWPVIFSPLITNKALHSSYKLICYWPWTDYNSLIFTVFIPGPYQFKFILKLLNNYKLINYLYALPPQNLHALILLESDIKLHVMSSGYPPENISV